jgi:hypothetical protein
LIGTPRCREDHLPDASRRPVFFVETHRIAWTAAKPIGGSALVQIMNAGSKVANARAVISRAIGSLTNRIYTDAGARQRRSADLGGHGNDPSREYDQANNPHSGHVRACPDG